MTLLLGWCKKLVSWFLVPQFSQKAYDQYKKAGNSNPIEEATILSGGSLFKFFVYGSALLLDTLFYGVKGMIVCFALMLASIPLFFLFIIHAAFSA